MPEQQIPPGTTPVTMEQFIELTFTQNLIKDMTQARTELAMTRAELAGAQQQGAQLQNQVAALHARIAELEKQMLNAEPTAAQPTAEAVMAETLPVVDPTAFGGGDAPSDTLIGGDIGFEQPVVG